MDFSLSEEQELYQQEFDKFCQKKIAPNARAIAENPKVFKENYKALAEIGYLSAHIPESLGGEDLELPTIGFAHELLAKYCASSFLSAGASIGLFGNPIASFGSKEQKDKIIPALMNADLIGCLAITEPGIGSDVASTKTTAKKVGDKYILNGEKAMITNAPIADYAVVVAKTDPDASYAGFTQFLVDLNQAGIERSKPYNKLGLRGSPTGGFVLKDVELSEADIVGSIGGGFLQTMQVLEFGRIGMTFFSIGIAQAAMEAAIKYSSEREAFGRPIQKFQAIHFKIADMQIEIQAARAMALRVASMKQSGEALGDLASIAKLYSSEVAVRAADNSLQIHGGWGYTDDYDIERYYRDARLGPIGEGSSEIQRELISRMMIGS